MHTRTLQRLGGSICLLAIASATVSPQSAFGQCETKRTASDGWEGDYFGKAVSVSGSVAVIGSGFGEAAYVFRFDGSEWHEEARLTASDRAPDDAFGRSLDMEGQCHS